MFTENKFEVNNDCLLNLKTYHCSETYIKTLYGLKHFLNFKFSFLEDFMKSTIFINQNLMGAGSLR